MRDLRSVAMPLRCHRPPWARRLLPVLGTLLASGAAAAAPPPSTAPPPLLVSAAVSLREVLQRLSPGFQRRHRVPAPQFNLAASGTLQRQIEQGAPVDVLLSAGDRPMQALERVGLLRRGSRRTLIGNRLVLVASARQRRILGFADLASPRIRRIAIGDSAVPAGDYARQVLQHHGLSASVRTRLIPLGSVRAVAAAVASGSADVGFVYRTDAIGMAGLRIVATAPASSHEPIVYSGAVLARSRQPGLAAAWLASLTAPEARRTWQQAGFLPLPPGL